MKEYIEKEAVLEILKRNSVGTWRGVPAYPAEIKSAAHEIGNLPAADVAEVRHGKLNFVQEDMSYCYYGICNVCGAYVQAWNYCPNCGALMKEDEYEAG